MSDYGIGSLATLLTDLIQNGETSKEIEDLMNPPQTQVNYQEYIQSEDWKLTARIIKRLAGFQCEMCGIQGNDFSLKAHHLTYARLGHERLSDLQCLCQDCHTKVHRNFKPKVDEIDTEPF